MKNRHLNTEKLFLWFFKDVYSILLNRYKVIIPKNNLLILENFKTLTFHFRRNDSLKSINQSTFLLFVLENQQAHSDYPLTQLIH